MHKHRWVDIKVRAKLLQRKGSRYHGCIVETKLVVDIDLMIDGKSKCNIWKKDRKQGRGGGVMMLIKQSLKVNEVWYGKKTTEVMAVQAAMNDEEKYDIITTCVPS